MSVYIRKFELQEKEVHLRRNGQYSEAAQLLLDAIPFLEEACQYEPQPDWARWHVHADLRTRIGDYWRYAEDYAKASDQYRLAVAYLNGHALPPEAVSRENALPNPDRLHAKLPLVARYCDGDPNDVITLCGRQIDGPIEIADMHLSFGRAFKDKQSVDRATAKLVEVQQFVDRQDIPNKLPAPLMNRYGGVREKISHALQQNSPPPQAAPRGDSH